ncbi:hypothetical protein [Floccifex sp.]|uniref:hypothetical protein n=1 Tax=Floccifex sp. TaxID=2815810 RepID=UPI003F0A8C5B
MKIISYSISDKKNNEDIYSYSNCHVLVIDGATGLSKNKTSKEEVVWFVQQLKKEIDAHIYLSLSLSQIVEEALNKIQSHYKDIDKFDNIELPNACISLFRFQNQELEYYGLGDCCGVIETIDGNITCFEDTTISMLDQEVIDHMMSLSKQKNISFLETRKLPEIQEHIIKNRRCANTLYFILDPTKKGISHAIEKRWPLKNIKRICAMSDGFSQIMNIPGYETMNKVLEGIENNPEKIQRDLYDFQQQDAQCIQLPRLKKRDDTTYVFVRF